VCRAAERHSITIQTSTAIVPARSPRADAHPSATAVAGTSAAPARNVEPDVRAWKDMNAAWHG
jgi:hypothetical protein